MEDRFVTLWRLILPLIPGLGIVLIILGIIQVIHLFRLTLIDIFSNEPIYAGGDCAFCLLTVIGGILILSWSLKK